MPNPQTRDQAIDAFLASLPPGIGLVDALRRAYQQFLGRDIDPDTLAAAQARPEGTIRDYVGGLYDASEGAAYRARPAGSVASDPAATRPAAGDFGRMEGYDARNWGSMNSMKYRAGEILSRYPATPEGLKQAFNDPDFKALFPNAKLIGKDTIDFGGMLSDFDRGVPVHEVDVGTEFDERNNTGRGWAWQDARNTGGSAGGASSGWGYRPPSLPTGPAPLPPSDPGPPGEMPVPEQLPALSEGDAPMSAFLRDQQAAPRVIPGDVYMHDLVRRRNERIGPGWRTS